MEFGFLLGDQPLSTPPGEHLDLLLRNVEAGQRAGFTHFTIGQHFLYSDFRWMQPIPILARLAAEIDDHVRIGTTVLVGPLQHPVQLAEDLATLDIITGGKLIVGLGTGYLEREYAAFDKPYSKRYGMLEEQIEILTALWTQDRVTYDGQFWQLDDVTTHIHPIQKPRPPIWLGAMKKVGVRRAARSGDVWTITPQQTVDEVAQLVQIYVEERQARGLPLTPFPLRRELQVADSYDEALRDFAAVARGKYVSYASQGMGLLDQERVEREFLANIADHVLLGTGAQVRDQITAIAGRLPIGPLLIRPHWPGMDAEQSALYLERVGREVVAPLKDLQSVGFDALVA
ncbi:LLM class flavin-dependent oxidoreductase [Gordonia sp. HNM0687]|uniref:LLM class flavin-dependent oxidoreductase n=1 Tax=Gordonia mangrovi TaxID=2665643 RepID=A0A6L7GZF4_9ACTN|nr:LLM class flavin-dependent oxidoreductase [Gordonia mangrovi]MXP24255.1 LLM class flavin-dependent oxidoreductase [Gordonia mangrovi]UVF79924.1 LLM class flavin-dependent oxidoreductase [Gordonia mangrovi]